jgi:hypothetical protein
MLSPWLLFAQVALKIGREVGIFPPDGREVAVRIGHIGGEHCP